MTQNVLILVVFALFLLFFVQLLRIQDSRSANQRFAVRFPQLNYHGRKRNDVLKRDTKRLKRLRGKFSQAHMDDTSIDSFIRDMDRKLVAIDREIEEREQRKKWRRGER